MISNSRAVIYARVSSREQEETGYSLPAQEDFLKEYSQKKGFHIEKIFSVAESASGAKQRRVFNEMMEFVNKQKIPILLCEKVDRLTRNLKEAVVANDWIESDEKRQIHFVKQNLVLHANSKSDEKFRWDIEIVIAKKTITNLSEEVKKGQKEKINQGWFPGKPPIGYRSIGEKGHKTYIVDEELRHYIKRAYELYAAGNYSVVTLAELLNSQGLRTRNGKKISRSRLHQLLSESFYYGEFKWNDEIYKGKHEAIIDKELWDKVQDKLHEKNTGTKKPARPLLQGQMHCKHCGGMVSWYKQKGHTYGHCSYHGKSKYCEGKKCVREELVEEQIIKIIESIAPANKEILKWIEEIIYSEYGNQAEEREKEVRHINRLLKDVRAKKDKVLDAKFFEGAPMEYCERKLKDCSDEERVLEERMSKLGEKSDSYRDIALMTHELAYKAGEVYEAGTREEKRELFSELFVDLIQDREEIGPVFTESACYLHKWMPILNAYYEHNSGMPSYEELKKSSELVKKDENNNSRLRTKENGSTKGKSAPKDASSVTLLRGQGSNL